MDEHGPAVRQPRRARHIDQFRRDRTKTGAAARGATLMPAAACGTLTSQRPSGESGRDLRLVAGAAVHLRASEPRTRLGPESSVAVKLIRVSRVRTKERIPALTVRQPQCRAANLLDPDLRCRSSCPASET
jgi:hypothetical protein